MAGIPGPELDKGTETLIRDYNLGGIIFLFGVPSAFSMDPGFMMKGWEPSFGKNFFDTMDYLASNWMLRLAPDTVGPPLPTVQIRITDDSGDELRDGEPGHIEARSWQMMIGYYDNLKADADTIMPGRWIRTGDYGRLDDGILYISTRLRDLIIRGGENIYPFEIENRLDEHPEVIECAVFGIESATYGQEAKAIVVVRSGAEVEVAELREFCAVELAYYKVPAVIEIRDEPLPRTASGKVMKHVLAGAENTQLEE